MLQMKAMEVEQYENRLSEQHSSFQILQKKQANQVREHESELALHHARFQQWLSDKQRQAADMQSEMEHVRTLYKNLLKGQRNAPSNVI